MERLFQILAVILAGVAAFFLWQDKTDAMFVSAVFGAVCFFLSYRFQVKERLNQREKEAREIVTTDVSDN
ncbi:hypothetical protein BH24ACI2_BH24ACI2_06570 [soil metagenome]|jgi:hypothetical protein|nr:hypothetical protein [Acidobacteriota bacterium]